MKDILQEIKREMGYSNLEDADMLEMAEFYDNLSDADLDNLNDAEYAEYLDYMDALEMAEKTKKRRGGARKQPMRRGKTPGGRTFLKGKGKLAALGGGGTWAAKNQVSSKPPQFGSKAYVNEIMTSSKGDLNITVTRESANIAATPLPYILFGLNGLSSSFISTIRSYLPSGVTMVATIASNGDVLQTFTSGANVDIVRISLTGSQISYAEFLANMNTNFFKTRYCRQEYPNDANLLSAVSQTINFGLLSALGMKNANSLLPRSRRLADDYQTNIINLFLPEQKVVSDFSFVQNIVAVANYTIAWDVFMSDRKNLNNM